MTEEHTQYTVSGLLIENELLRERVEALRKTADGFTDASNNHWDSQNRRIKELEATVARLEADNRRLRKLDAMPLDAIERYHAYTHYDVHAANDAGYTTQQFDMDDAAIGAWLEVVTHD